MAHQTTTESPYFNVFGSDEVPVATASYPGYTIPCDPEDEADAIAIGEAEQDVRAGRMCPLWVVFVRPLWLADMIADGFFWFNGRRKKELK